MNITDQINEYIACQPDAKQRDMQELHDLILTISPGCQLWFKDGKDSEGKVVTNPDIGYGSYQMKYADGSTRDFYRIGLSANKTGISVYILGIEDKTFLNQTYGSTLGKATITGYCIKFKANKDIDLNVLKSAIRFGFELH